MASATLAPEGVFRAQDLSPPSASTLPVLLNRVTSNVQRARSRSLSGRLRSTSIGATASGLFLSAASAEPGDYTMEKVVEGRRAEREQDFRGYIPWKQHRRAPELMEPQAGCRRRSINVE